MCFYKRIPQNFRQKSISFNLVYPVAITENDKPSDFHFIVGASLKSK